MGKDTAIEWADHTMNPWVGCEKVSPGCAHCYAETLVTGRMARGGTWGADGRRERTSPSTWAAPARYERNAARFMEENGRRQRVFCASLADVFEPRAEVAEWRRDLFDLIVATPSLDWLILTKRPEEARDWLQDWYEEPVRTRTNEPGLFRLEGDENLEPTRRSRLPNVWLGVSIENARHTYRAAVLREIPAAVRFISAEPLLGSLYSLRRNEKLPPLLDERAVAAPLDLTGIDWVIVGGESGGRSSRPMHPDWVREIRDAALGAVRSHFRPAFLFKQWGSWSPGLTTPGGSQSDRRHAFGDGAVSVYRGPSPKSGGRLLDGVEWTEFPAAAARVRTVG